MKSELDAGQISAILDYNFLHPDEINCERSSVGWQTCSENPRSFIIGDIVHYDEWQQLLTLHYHSYFGPPGDIWDGWKMKREAMGMFHQIASSLIRWEYTKRFSPSVSTLVAATHPLLGKIVRKIAPVFTPIGVLPFDTAYVRSLRSIDKDIPVSKRHWFLGDYEILAADVVEFTSHFRDGPLIS